MNVKKRICQNITRTYYFDRIGEDSVQMDDVYNELISKYPNNKRFETNPHKDLAKYYRRMYYLKMFFTYPTKLVNISVGAEIFQEYAFACFTRHRGTKKILVNYVSDSYNMVKAVRTSPDLGSYIAGRFIFRVSYSTTGTLMAIAEEPGTLLSSNVEDIYRQRRKNLKSGNFF